MLELPEVEVLRKDLEREVVGKRVKEVQVTAAAIVRPYHRNRPEFVKALEGHKIEAVRRRGTVLFLDLDEDLTWTIDPGDTASLHRETMNEPAGPGTDVVVTFTTGGAIHVTNPDRGESCHMGVVARQEAFTAAGLSPHALDLLDDSPTWIEFGELLRGAAAPLKQVLMDESRVLGVRAVYSDEALWEAGLSHDRSSDTLSTQEVRRLYRAIQETLQAAIKHRGTSLEDASPDEAFDDEGEPVEHLKVYGRDGLPCLRCRRTVVKDDLAHGGTTYHCTGCQI
ncbi:MAG TPA: DNA-formamidopyrimidine glycosylase family protein [Nitriliruptorales bacterium]|nr:DNA-formamidopyrimidine glycosylase family protein [Nitriliruptorales bacterium]